MKSTHVRQWDTPMVGWGALCACVLLTLLLAPAAPALAQSAVGDYGTTVASDPVMRQAAPLWEDELLHQYELQLPWLIESLAVARSVNTYTAVQRLESKIEALERQIRGLEGQGAVWPPPTGGAKQMAPAQR